MCAVTVEGEPWFCLPVGNRSEQTPSAGSVRKSLGAGVGGGT